MTCTPMPPLPETEPFDDDALVSAFLAGTSSGLARVYGAYGRRLYAAARAILRNDDDAQDCVHDTLLRVWQHAESFRPERGALRAYLVVAVRNAALARLRTTARRQAIDERLARAERASDGDRHDDPYGDPLERERLRRALDALPPEQRTALELAFFGRLTHVEVAARVAAPLGTVKSRIALALRKLHAALVADGTDAS